MYPDVRDLDIAVTTKWLEQLKQKYSIISKTNDFNIVNDDVEYVCVDGIDKLKYKHDVVNGYKEQNIYEYLKNSERKNNSLSNILIYVAFLLAWFCDIIKLEV